MNKKILVILATGSLLVTSIAAAGCSKKAPEQTETTVEVQALIVDPQNMIEDHTVLLPMCITNPALDYAGSYFNKQKTLEVEAIGDDYAKLTVVLDKTDKKETTLTVNGRLNAETSSITYFNAIKREITLDEKGEPVSEKEIYVDGAGNFVFDTEQATWNDSKEKVENMIFQLGEPLEHEQLEQIAEASSKKAAKKAKKTVKKAAKKTKKPSKKPAKKPAQDKGLFRYGHSEYVCKDFTVYVDVRKDNSASIRVVTHNQDNDIMSIETFWTAEGKIDPNTGKMTYTRGTKQDITRTSRGLMGNRMDYLDGTGEFHFNGNELRWTDHREHYADSYTFKRR